MDIVPCDCIVSATGSGASDGENESLIEGSPQQAQHHPALRGVWKVGCPGCSFIWLTRVGMLLLQTDRKGFSALSNLPRLNVDLALR